MLLLGIELYFKLKSQTLRSRYIILGFYIIFYYTILNNYIKVFSKYYFVIITRFLHSLMISTCKLNIFNK